MYIKLTNRYIFSCAVEPYSSTLQRQDKALQMSTHNCLIKCVTQKCKNRSLGQPRPPPLPGAPICSYLPLLLFSYLEGSFLALFLALFEVESRGALVIVDVLCAHFLVSSIFLTTLMAFSNLQLMA